MDKISYETVKTEMNSTYQLISSKKIMTTTVNSNKLNIKHILK